MRRRERDGVWQYQGAGGAESFAAEKDMLRMTPWAKAKFDEEYLDTDPGLRAGGNDPILQCDPIGFPRVMFMPHQSSSSMLLAACWQFFEREHEWRPIWTDGRSLPTDVDPAWYGHAIGHWEARDYTLVVESSGFNDKSWLSPAGYPHTEDMRITNAISASTTTLFSTTLTVVDPMAYTKPIEGRHVTLKLRPHEEIEGSPCVWSEENAFTKRIREPAAAKTTK